MKTKKILMSYTLILSLLITILFFMFPIIIAYDSAHYFNYVSILNGNKDISTWDVARGPGYPLILYLGIKIFGNSAQTLLLINYIAYVIFITYSYKTIKLFLKNKSIIFFIMIFIIINPIIFGYYHVLLTEAWAIALSELTLYYLLLYCTNKEKIELNKIIILYSLISILIYHIKQPYIFLIMGPLILMIFYLIKNIEYRKALLKILLISVISLILSITLWNCVIKNNIVTYDKNRTSSGFFTTQLMNGLTEFERTLVTDYTNLPNDINNIENNKVIFKISCHKKEPIFIILNENISIVDAIHYVIKCITYSPLNVVESYLNNYLSTINFYLNPINIKVNNKEELKKPSLFRADENSALGYRIYRINEETKNIFYMTPELYENVAYYSIYSESPLWVQLSTPILFKLTNFTFTIFGLFAPFILLSSFVIKDKILKLLLYMSGSIHFFNIMIFTILGATIDRYIITSYSICFVLLIIIIITSCARVYLKTPYDCAI